MRRLHAVALAASAALALSAAPSWAHSDAHGFAFGDDDDDFTWAIVSGDNTSMSGQLDPDTMDRLKDRFGSRFLYFQDGDDRWVVTDRALIERAQRATREIGRYGREIGAMARAQAKLALSDARPERRQEGLRKEEKALRKEIERAERRGEDTEALEARLERVTTELEVNDEVYRSFELSADQRRELTRRRDEAKARLHEAVRGVNQEMHDILREARSRRLAVDVD